MRARARRGQDGVGDRPSSPTAPNERGEGSEYGGVGRVVPVLAVILIGYLAFLAGVTARFGFNASSLIQIGERDSYYGNVALPPGTVVFRASDGYDGQYFYYIARDPLFQSRTFVNPVRYQRIGYPLLASLAALGRAEILPLALVAVNLAAILVGSALFMMLLAWVGLSRWLGLLFAFNPGQILGLQMDLAFPVQMALIMGAFVAWRRGGADRDVRPCGHAAPALEFERADLRGMRRPDSRAVWPDTPAGPRGDDANVVGADLRVGPRCAGTIVAAGLCAAALLVSESSVLFLAPLIAAEALGRRWRAAAILGLSVVPYLALQLVLYRAMGGTGAGVSAEHVVAPLQGMAAPFSQMAMERGVAGTVRSAFVAGTAAFVLVAGVVALGKLRRGFDVFAAGVVAHAAFAAVASEVIWIAYASAGRVFAGILPLLALSHGVRPGRGSAVLLVVAAVLSAATLLRPFAITPATAFFVVGRLQ